ncbi:efflux transporter outer membrane subunit [Uliginosibacterium sp. sgz301328]|uniref:efflux transporter outer membrane subunit n=1 Tax=Uliginosibacterium sp. sgz301328 TaxID=3243764 RepID=UPI00359DEDD0
MKSSPFRLAMLISMVAVLAACASDGGISSHATLAQPDTLGAAPVAARGTAAPAEGFWRSLGDPQLNALIDEALADSPSLRIADARIRRAQSITGVAQSATMPTLSLDADTLQQRLSENWIYPPPLAGAHRTDNRVAWDAGLELDLWGKYRAALKGAEAQQAAAEVEAKAARIALATSIARAWIEFDRLFRQHDQIDRMIATREDIERLQAIRIKAGLDAELDRNLQQQGTATLKTERAVLDERIGLQRDLLAALVGKGPQRGAQLTRPQLPDRLDAGLPSVLPSDLLANRPDVTLSRLHVEAAARAVDVSHASFYPTVNLKAFLGFQSIGIENLLEPAARIYGIGPSIRIPIFEGGRLRADLGVKQADYDAAVEQYNATLVDALREVTDQARSLEGAERQGQSAEEAVATARQGVALVETRVRQRLSSRIQLMSAQMLVMTHERVDIDLRARRLDAAVSLSRALGGGFIPDNNPFTQTAAR